MGIMAGGFISIWLMALKLLKGVAVMHDHRAAECSLPRDVDWGHSASRDRTSLADAGAATTMSRRVAHRMPSIACFD